MPVSSKEFPDIQAIIGCGFNLNCVRDSIRTYSQVKTLFQKDKKMETEFAPGFFNSTTKTVLNFKYDPDKCFQEFFYRIDNQSNEGSGCLIVSVDAVYVNIPVYSPFSGKTYTELPCELKNSMKGFFNIK